MTQITPNLGLVKPGGGSTGLNTPPDRVDIDVLNANFDVLDAAVGDPDERNVRWTGPAAQINSLPDSPKDGDTYQESDGNKILWRRVGGVWVTNEGGAYLIRPTSVAGCQVDPATGRVLVSGSNTAWSLNGIFSNRFRKYRIDYNFRFSAQSLLFMRFRIGGTDDAAGSYFWASVEGTGVAVSSASGSSQTELPISRDNAVNHWGHIEIESPFQAGGDLAHITKIEGQFNDEHAGTRALVFRQGYYSGSENKAFDGITLFSTGGALYSAASYLRVTAIA